MASAAIGLELHPCLLLIPLGARGHIRLELRSCSFTFGFPLLGLVHLPLALEGILDGLVPVLRAVLIRYLPTSSQPLLRRPL
jgi:hypothetical protein